MRADGETSSDLARAAREVVDGLASLGQTVSCAESLTAGLVCSSIADVPGASAVLRGGAVTYVNEIKERVLGVSPETIERDTEVSHAAAREMALGALELFGSDRAVSLTGYAGPGGGTAENPVGTVYIGYADRQGASSERRSFRGDRSSVRHQAALAALELLARGRSRAS